MTVRKYIGDSKMFEYDKYYRECKQENRPFVKARKSAQGNDYFVQLDMITCNYNLSEQSQKTIRQHIEKEIQFVATTQKNTFRDYHVDKEVAWFDGISSQHVDMFCNNLYDLTQQNPC